MCCPFASDCKTFILDILSIFGAMKIVVLGGSGEMGRVIVTDLAETFDGTIVVAGRDSKKAKSFAGSFGKKNVKSEEIDINDISALGASIENADSVINATNYYANLNVMNAALEAGIDYVDLGGLYHMTKKQLKLDGAFRKRGLTAIIGCGSAPGITNVMAAHITGFMERVESLHIQFAGRDYTHYSMPFVLPYSMRTLFDEFSKKPAIFKNGKFRYVEPVSDEVKVKFPSPVSEACCFYTLHSELATLPAWLKKKGIHNCSFRGGFDPDLVSKTKFLIEAGFADEKPVKVLNAEIAPRDLSVALLNKFMPYRAKVNDVEFLRVEATGFSNGRRRKMIAYCKSVSNKKHNIPAGSWDTGVPASIAGQMLAHGKISEKGVMAPESCINPRDFFAELAKRNIDIIVR